MLRFSVAARGKSFGWYIWVMLLSCPVLRCDGMRRGIHLVLVWKKQVSKAEGSEELCCKEEIVYCDTAVNGSSEQCKASS